MKIPKTIRLNGIEYTVEEVDHLDNGVNLAYGYINYETHQILISKEKNIGYQKKCLVLLHEIMHGIAEAYRLDLGDNEEEIVDTFARGIYQVLQDNGQRLFNIKEDSNVHRSGKRKNKRAAKRA